MGRVRATCRSRLAKPSVGCILCVFADATHKCGAQQCGEEGEHEGQCKIVAGRMSACIPSDANGQHEFEQSLTQAHVRQVRANRPAFGVVLNQGPPGVLPTCCSVPRTLNKSSAKTAAHPICPLP